jgi:hypothetical protein
MLQANCKLAGPDITSWSLKIDCCESRALISIIVNSNFSILLNCWPPVVTKRKTIPEWCVEEHKESSGTPGTDNEAETAPAVVYIPQQTYRSRFCFVKLHIVADFAEQACQSRGCVTRMPISERYKKRRLS